MCTFYIDLLSTLLVACFLLSPTKKHNIPIYMHLSTLSELTDLFIPFWQKLCHDFLVQNMTVFSSWPVKRLNVVLRALFPACIPTRSECNWTNMHVRKYRKIQSHIIFSSHFTELWFMVRMLCIIAYIYEASVVGCERNINFPTKAKAVSLHALEAISFHQSSLWLYSPNRALVFSFEVF
jgi:hypothetical protein